MILVPYAHSKPRRAFPSSTVPQIMILSLLCCSTSIMCTVPYMDPRSVQAFAAAGRNCSLLWGAPLTLLTTAPTALAAMLATHPLNASVLTARKDLINNHLIWGHSPVSQEISYTFLA